uniref:Uncharacterized protein n=2 Tax=Lotharella globosa TaxID=91324 RepID=A0A6U3DS93_9EUKA|mmetsp:Transcript_40505/g.78846  ORF Transcript_40505/g.78846 Transcript_40505/m.78846 type:complete len:140 (+) Transcript_40505:107-526(+)
MFPKPSLASSSEYEYLIPNILATTFEQMLLLDGGKGESLKPFLQDVVQPKGLLGGLLGVVVTCPSIVPKILQHVGPKPIIKWVGDVAAMVSYAAVNTFTNTNEAKNKVASWFKTEPVRFRARQALDAIKYGSGGDFNDH